MQGAYGGSQSAPHPFLPCTLPKTLLLPSSPLPTTFFSLDSSTSLTAFSSLCPALTSHPWVTSSTPGFSPKFRRLTLPWAPGPATSVSDLTFNMPPSPHLLFLFRLYFSKFLHHQLICETSLAPLVCLTSNQPQVLVNCAS